jgi:hypothetical protein
MAKILLCFRSPYTCVTLPQSKLWRTADEHLYNCITYSYAFFLIVLESFEDYVSVETLDGENKYDAGDHGLQVNAA